MSSAKTARWLDLIAYLLQHRFPVTREDIFARVKGYADEPPSPGGGRGQGVRVRSREPEGEESIRRMFERDKDELRSLGIKIETVPIPDAEHDEPASGYRLAPRDFYLPYLELGQRSNRAMERRYQGLARLTISQDELSILDRATQLVAQRTESPLGKSAASARRKLEFDLPLPTAAVERVLEAPLDDEGTKALEVLQRAVAEQVAVSCRYHSIGRDQEETRVIEPYGLFFNWGRWYCVAKARDRDALRVFRIDRMRGAAMEKGKAASFTVPREFSIRDYLDRAPWELSSTPATEVRVRFAFPESRWVQAQRAGDVIEPMTEDGGAILQFQVRDAHPFLRWLLTFRRHVEVLEPEPIRAALDAMRRQVAGLYVEPGR